MSQISAAVRGIPDESNAPRVLLTTVFPSLRGPRAADPLRTVDARPPVKRIEAFHASQILRE